MKAAIPFLVFMALMLGCTERVPSEPQISDSQRVRVMPICIDNVVCYQYQVNGGLSCIKDDQELLQKYCKGGTLT